MAKAIPPVTTATTRSDPQTTATVTPAGMVSDFVIYWIMSCVSSTMLFKVIGVQWIHILEAK